MYKKESSSSSGSIQDILLPKRLYISIASLITLIMILGIGYFAYTKYFPPKGVSETEDLVRRVGKLISLPNSETPQITTVTAKEKPIFFASAENEDKVLVYPNARMAYLYRPKSNKLIEVTTINLETKPSVEASSSPKVSSSPAASKEVKVAILNGTKTRGLASKTEKELVKSFPQITVTQTGNTKGDYEKTMVIVIETSSKKTAEDIAKNLKVTVAPLPSGETEPKDAVILVILGEDKVI